LILPGDIITAVVKLDASQCTLDTTSVSFEFKRKMIFASKSDIICVESVASKCPSGILKAGEVSERIVALTTPKKSALYCENDWVHLQATFTGDS
jgi:uncharacterized Fe-S cluster protein YjdI